jgi:uncharacterized protein YcbK (DUF882 family)
MLDRRSFLTAGTAALVTTLATPNLVLAGSKQARTLHMINHRNGEVFKRQIFDGRRFSKDALQEFNWFARDWRRGKADDMDPETVLIASNLQHYHGGRRMALISGYRTPKTNRSLTGAAKGSFHMKGMALDLQVEGVSTSRVYKTAWKMQRGGVGKYTRSGFVHVDSGPVRTWGS